MRIKTDNLKSPVFWICLGLSLCASVASHAVFKRACFPSVAADRPLLPAAGEVLRDLAGSSFSGRR